MSDDESTRHSSEAQSAKMHPACSTACRPVSRIAEAKARTHFAILRAHRNYAGSEARTDRLSIV